MLFSPRSPSSRFPSTTHAAAALLVLLVSTVAFEDDAQAARILVSDQSNQSSWLGVGTPVLNQLAADGHTVDSDTTGTMPAFVHTSVDPVNGYDWLLIFGNTNVHDAAAVATITSFLQAGGHVHLQFEVGCCDIAAADRELWAQSLVVGGSNLQFDVTVGGGAVAWQTNCPDQSEPATATSAALRRLDNVNPNNVLLTAGSDVAAAAWAGADLAAGNGTVVALGDLNILYDGGGYGTVDPGPFHFFFPPVNPATSVANCSVIEAVGPVDVDTDMDGVFDSMDTDDDNDGVPDVSDSAPLNPDICQDLDNDTCDDCAIGADDLGPQPDAQPNADGLDTDNDGLCDMGDPDIDNDGLDNATDIDPLDPSLCGDSDMDGCDDCAVGGDGFGPLPDNDPSNDGVDEDNDGICNPKCIDGPCDADSFCGPDMICYDKKDLGAPASDPSECEGGIVSDGVCCDSACDNGVCDVCTVALGAAADGSCSSIIDTCDDSNSCTSHSCDPLLGCLTQSLLDGSGCEGGVCVAGECIPDAVGSATSTTSSTSGNGGAGGVDPTSSGNGGAPSGGELELEGGGCGVTTTAPTAAGRWSAWLLLATLLGFRRRRRG